MPNILNSSFKYIDLYLVEFKNSLENIRYNKENNIEIRTQKFKEKLKMVKYIPLSKKKLINNNREKIMVFCKCGYMDG